MARRGPKAPRADGSPPPLPAPAVVARRRGGGGVAGPTSALTAFLKDQGINAHRSMNGYSNTVTDPANAVTNEATQAGPSNINDGPPIYDDDVLEERENAPINPGLKRSSSGRKVIADDLDSDDLDGDSDVPGPSNKKARFSEPNSGTTSRADTPASNAVASGSGSGGGLRAVGEFMMCGECSKRFPVTPYTQPHPSKANVWICHACCGVLGIDAFKKPKKAAGRKPAGGGAGVPAKKEERRKVVSYEERKGVSPLGDLCIKLIGKSIEDVEALGNIGLLNMDKVCRIISKSRRLTAETATLFYSAERDELSMYDCTNLLPENYMTLASLCPNIQSLRLIMCGRIDTDSFGAWGKMLKKLKRVELEGPFLVREAGWTKFFDGVGKNLEGFSIIQSPRFDKDCLIHMVKKCPNLNEINLCEFGKLTDDWLPHLSKFKKVQSLEISRPAQSLTDEPVIALLKEIGGNLHHLDLSRQFLLTDRFLNKGILPYCSNLTSLALTNLADFAFRAVGGEGGDADEDGEERAEAAVADAMQVDDGGSEVAPVTSRIGLSNEGVAEMFSKWQQEGNTGLARLNLNGCSDLRDEALRAVLAHSGKTLTALNIGGWKDTSAEALAEIGSNCPILEELDVGWCRNLSDFDMKAILDGCSKIKNVRVWGCCLLTDAVPRKKGCKVVGIETHTI